MVGNVFNNAISLLLLPVFTRLLSTSSYGIVSTYNSWVTIMTVVVGLQLYLTLRSAYSDYQNRLSAYCSAVDGLCIVSFLFFVVAALVADRVFHVFGSDFPVTLVYLCLGHALVASILNVERQKEMMALEYVRRTALLTLPNLIAALLGIAIIASFPKTDYMGRIGSNFAVHAIFGLAILFVHFRRGRAFFDKEIWKYGMGLSFPLIFHGLACDVLGSVDRTMITAFRSAAETGIYSVAYTLGMAIKVVTASVEAAWVPWFTAKMNAGHRDEVRMVAKRYVLVVSALCIAAMLCLPEILKLFSSREYWDGIWLIPPIALASFTTFLYSISVDVEYYSKATKAIAVNTIIAAGVNLLLNWLLIPKYGAVAAAYTTVVSYGVSFLIHHLSANRLQRGIFPFAIYVGPLFMAGAGTALCYLFMSNGVMRWGIGLIAGTIALSQAWSFEKKWRRT